MDNSNTSDSIDASKSQQDLEAMVDQAARVAVDKTTFDRRVREICLNYNVSIVALDRLEKYAASTWTEKTTAFFAKVSFSEKGQDYWVNIHMGKPNKPNASSGGRVLNAPLAKLESRLAYLQENAEEIVKAATKAAESVPEGQKQSGFVEIT